MEEVVRTPPSAAWRRRLDAAPGYPDLFGVVKEVVQWGTGEARTGLMLGLASLGLSPAGYIGGFFQLASNAIVLNRDALHHVRARFPEWHNAYAFHVLLHEYLHTLGHFPEREVRPLAYEVSRKALGEEHPATAIARAMAPGAVGGAVPPLLKELLMPEFGWAPTGDPAIEFVRGFDPDASPYIA